VRITALYAKILSKQMNLNKICNVDDWQEDELVEVLRLNLGPKEISEIGWPHGREDRKFWEIGMTLLAMHSCIPADLRRLALGVGAGTEATSFILTKYFDRVVATDLYGSSQWKTEAPLKMLSHPKRYAGSIPFNPERLIVECMDATTLRYECDTFDFVYSSSSIEHFGSYEAISRAAYEMGRVLKPGGLLSLSTEIRIGGASKWLNKSTLLFDKDTIKDLIIGPSRCSPVDSFDYRVSQITVSHPTEFMEAIKDSAKIANRLQGRWSRYPHVLMKHGELMWTSVQITLRKSHKADKLQTVANRFE
jgi:SAM-dependent methyltransferase